MFVCNRLKWFPVDPCVPNGVTVLANPCDRQVSIDRAFNTCINLNNGNFKCVCPDGYLAPREEDYYTCRGVFCLFLTFLTF